ncbi:MAG: NAD(P)-dependent oxidoreductase [Melioribacteraceae bacterium]
METILITGINGFLGSHIAKRLSKNYQIIGLEYSLENLFRIKGCSFPVYLSDNKSIEKIFNDFNVDIIIHTATFYGRNNEVIPQIAQTNLFMPFHLLDYAIKSKTKLFINTDTALDRFTSAYALTKKQFNDWIYFRSKEIKTVNMQLEHFYGPGCSNTNFITAMIEKLKRNESFIDLTLGEQKRDIVYYSDVVDAYETVVNSREEFVENFNHFEIGTGNLITIKEIMLLLKKLTNSRTNLNFGAVPYRENELMESKSDYENILKLGWLPKVNIEEGLLKTINGIE